MVRLPRSQEALIREGFVFVSGKYLVWMAWLSEQWNVPTKADYYQMQTSCEVRRVLSTNPRNIQIDHFKLKFGPKKPPISVSHAAMLSKAKWISFMTMNPVEG